MKKITMLILSVLLPLLGSAAATSTLSIEPLTISAGETKTMIIDLSNPDQQVTMVEFRMQLPQGLTVAPGDDALDIAGRTTWQKHTLYMNEQDGLTHIMLASPTNALISGTSGALISIRLTAGSTFSGGTITLTKQKIGSPDMTVSTPANYTYTIQGQTPPQPEAEAYAVYNNGTLTFYCDNQRSSRQGTTYDLNTEYDFPGWNNNSTSITNAVFDTSFANARPVSTRYWFDNCSSLTEIQGIEYLNTEKVTTMEWMFARCPNLTKIDVSHFNTANVTDMHDMFFDCEKLESLDVSHFDTHNVESFGSMFWKCMVLKNLDVTHFNTSKAVKLSNMFAECFKLKSIDVTGFDTENVEYMNDMFLGCNELTSIDVSHFNTRNVKDFSSMFHSCLALTTLDLSNFDTSSAIYASWLCRSCENLNTVTLGENFTLLGSEAFDNCNNIKKVVVKMQTPFATPSNCFESAIESSATLYVPKGTKAKYQSTVAWNEFKNIVEDEGPAIEPYAVYNNGTLTFYCDNQRSSREGATYDLNTGDNIPDWNDNRELITKAVFDASFANARPTSTRMWFGGCKNLIEIQGIAALNTSEVTSMFGMFSNCSGLTSLDVSNFNTAKVTRMSYMFQNCNRLTSLDVSNFNTANVKYMTWMFYHCSGLTSLDVSNFNTANVTDMNMMFYHCSGLTNLDVSNFNTEKVTGMSSMFRDCSGLTSIDVRNLNTEKVTSMYGMFSNCSGLTSLDISNFNTANVTSMSSMFSGCSGLTSLDVSNFNTSEVQYMYCMFSRCSRLTSLDVANFNTANVTDMAGMFLDCSGLKNVDVSGFNTAKVTTMDGMFAGCSSLTSLDLSSFDTSALSDKNSGSNGVGDYAIRMLIYDCSSLLKLTLGTNFVTNEEIKCGTVFTGCTNLNTVAFIGDIPSSIHSQFFNGVGTASIPATLEVPAEYREHYAAKMNGNMFYGGYFTLSGDDQPSQKKGDLNGDGQVNSTDLVIMVNMIMGSTAKTDAADMNSDGQVNSTDLVMLVNMIMGK